MKKFLKLTSAILAVVMVLAVSLLGIMAATESTAEIYADFVDLESGTGDTFDMTFKFKSNNLPIEGGKIKLTWNGTLASATNIVKASDLGDASINTEVKTGEATFIWAGSDIAGTTEAGSLFTVTFKKEALTNDGLFEVKINVENFGYTALFVPYEVKGSVKADAAYAGTPSGSVPVYTGTTEEEAIAWIKSALTAAKLGDVEAPIGADLVFSSTAKYTVIDIGSAEDVPNGKITFTSYGTDASGNPYGFVVDSMSTVNMYGNFIFTNIKIDGENTWTDGGTIQVSKGSAVFGVNDAAQNYGNIYVPSTSHKMNIAGDHIEVYDGMYRAICGNFYKSNRTVDTPYIKVGGEDVSVQYVLGGSHNGGNTITGASTVIIEGTPTITNIVGGSWCSNGVGSNGGTVTVNGNPTATFLIAGSVGDMSKANTTPYELTVNGGTYSHCAGHMFTSYGKATVNTKITVNGGSFGSLSGGAVSNWTSSGGKNFDAATTTNKLYGNTELTVKADPGCEIYGGSRMLVPSSDHAATSILTLDGITITKSFYGGSNMSKISSAQNTDGTYKYWINFNGTYKDNTDSVHSGDTTVNIKNGVLLKHPTSTTSGVMAYGGSSLPSTNSSHTGKTTVNMFVDEGSSATTSFEIHSTFWAGSYVNGTNTSHKGRIIANIDKANFNIKTSSWAGFSGGPYITASKAYADIKNEGAEKGIVINMTNSNCNKRIAVGYVSGANSYMKADSVFTFGTGNTHTNELYAGPCLANGGVYFEGNTQVVIAGNREGLTFGGSALTRESTDHIGSSEVVINSGTVSKDVFGGSNFPGDTTGYISGDVYGHKGDSGVVVNGGTITTSYVWGGSNMNTAAAQIPTGKAVHGVRYQAATADTAEVKASKSYVTFNDGSFTGKAVYGGAYLGKDGSVMNGDVEMTFNKGTILISERVAGVYLPGANSTYYGNSSITVAGTGIIDNNGTLASSGAGTGVAAGIYGSGKMYGDSKLEISGNGNIKWMAGETIITAGCYGTNDISTATTGLSDKNPYGGIRQVGNVTFIMKDNAQLGQYLSGTGHKSNIQGNMTLDIGGSAKIETLVYGLCRRFGRTEGYASVVGDYTAFFSGTPAFSYDTYVVGTHGSGNSPGQGINTVTGTTFVELKDFAPTIASGKKFICAGFSPAGDTVLKLVGNCQLPSNAFYFSNWERNNAASLKRILDLIQYTGTLTNGLPGNILVNSVANTTYTFTTWEPLNNKNVTFASNELAVGADMASLVSGKNVTIGNTTVAYADLTKYDDLSRYPNAFKFYSAEQDKEITKAGAATNDIYVKVGSVQSADIHLENTALQNTITSVENNFKFVGNSIRMPRESNGNKLALRCRASIDQQFLADHATKANGFVIKELGILISINSKYDAEAIVLGGEGISKAVAVIDGQVNTADMPAGWMTDESKYPGQNLFAAAITSFTEERYDVDLYFRPYMIVEDENGDTFVVYREILDDNGELPEEVTVTSSQAGALIAGPAFEQYKTSLYTRAKYEKTNNTALYKNALNTPVIDAIVTYVEGKQ